MVLDCPSLRTGQEDRLHPDRPLKSHQNRITTSLTPWQITPVHISENSCTQFGLRPLLCEMSRIFRAESPDFSYLRRA